MNRNMKKDYREMTFVTKHVEQLKMITILGMTLLLNANIAESQIIGAAFDMRPFETRIDLGLNTSSINIPEANAPRWPAELDSKKELSDYKEIYETNVNDEKKPDKDKYQRLHVYISHLALDNKYPDLQQKSNGSNETIHTLITIPSMLLNQQYRDTLESIGKIFEPQLNLGIEF